MIPFSEAVKRFYVNAFKFKGRATRAEFWWAQLFFIVACLLCGVLITASMGFGSFIGTLFIISIIIPSISLAVRRLHDIGLSGWWLLVISIALFILNSQAKALNTIEIYSINRIASLIPTIIYAWKGNHFDNEYGPNPYATNQDTEQDTKQNTQENTLQ